MLQAGKVTLEALVTEQIIIALIADPLSLYGAKLLREIGCKDKVRNVVLLKLR